MKIGELNMHCGMCGVIDFCGDPYEFCLCGVIDLEDVEEEDYTRLAEQSKRRTKETICNDVLRKLKKEITPTIHNYR